MKKIGLIFLAGVIIAGCKPSAEPVSGIKGLGGNPSDWTCNELNVEYKNKRAELVNAISSFNASYAKIENAANNNGTNDNNSQANNINPGDVSSSDEPGGSTVDDPSTINESSGPDWLMDDQDGDPTTTASIDDGSNVDGLALQGTAEGAGTAKIGEGADDLPQLPSAVAALTDLPKSPYHKHKNPAECDDKFGQYAQDPNNQILEQCRHVVSLFNLTGSIKYEFNYGRNGECRSGKGAFQQNQNSTRFGYCENPCRFGQTYCVKCTFNMGPVSSHYICGDENDTRNAITDHCSASNYSCSGSTAQCSEPQAYNDIQGGNTSNRESNTKLEVKVSVGTKAEIEVDAGVTVKAHQETKMDVTISGSLILKNSRGSEILSTNGGETASTYACSIAVSAALVRDVGAEVGAGFDVVVAKGSATAKAGANFSAMTEFKETSRDIPAAGQPLVNMLDGCKNFALDWGKNTLPNLVARNVVIKAVASRFMGETSDELFVDTSSKNIYCRTNISGITSDTKTYRITKVYTKLEQGRIKIKVAYDGYYNRFDGTSIWTNWNEPSTGNSREQYVAMRKIIFNPGPSGLSTSQLRYLVRGTGVKDTDQEFTDCSRTSW